MKLDPIRSAPAAMEAQNNKLAWVYRPVLEFLNLEATAKAPLETGGILMGTLVNLEASQSYYELRAPVHEPFTCETTIDRTLGMTNPKSPLYTENLAG